VITIHQRCNRQTDGRHARSVALKRNRSPTPTQPAKFCDFTIQLNPRTDPAHVQLCSDGLCACVRHSVDGGWSTWASWSTCGSDCRHHRQRTCDNPAPQHHGRYCVGTDLRLGNCTGGLCRPGIMYLRRLTSYMYKRQKLMRMLLLYLAHSLPARLCSWWAGIHR